MRRLFHRSRDVPKAGSGQPFSNLAVATDGREDFDRMSRRRPVSERIFRAILAAEFVGIFAAMGALPAGAILTGTPAGNALIERSKAVAGDVARGFGSSMKSGAEADLREYGKTCAHAYPAQDEQAKRDACDEKRAGLRSFFSSHESFTRAPRLRVF